MTRAYSVGQNQLAADRAVVLAREYLRFREPDSRIHDVQLDPRFQHRGVDLLWELASGEVRGVEVKGDRQGKRGNYFFELVSNFEKNTPGCFLYTEANSYVYVFLDSEEVHELPMPRARQWLVPRRAEFELKHTRTRTGPHWYTTVGAVVPVKRLLSELDDVPRARMREGGFEWMK